MQLDLPTDVTKILNDLGSRDQRAVAELLPVVYTDLRRMADSYFRREREDHTLQPTALVHEAYLKLMNDRDGGFKSREHFFRTAAVVMRHILVQHAREKNAAKRGGNFQQIEFTDDLAVSPPEAVDLLALDEALRRLSEFDGRQNEIVELRFFAGLTVAEVAETLGLSKRTVEEEWTLARAWLWRELKRQD